MRNAGVSELLLDEGEAPLVGDSEGYRIGSRLNRTTLAGRMDDLRAQVAEWNIDPGDDVVVRREAEANGRRSCVQGRSSWRDCQGFHVGSRISMTFLAWHGSQRHAVPQFLLWHFCLAT